VYIGIGGMRLDFWIVFSVSPFLYPSPSPALLSSTLGEPLRYFVLGRVVLIGWSWVVTRPGHPLSYITTSIATPVFAQFTNSRPICLTPEAYTLTLDWKDLADLQAPPVQHTPLAL